MNSAGAPWLFHPDYRAANPYQSLLAAALPPPWQAIAGECGTALDLAASGTPTVFHLHWEDAAYRAARTEAEACALAAAFLAECAAFRALGGQFVWSVHNAAPHENRFPHADRGLRAGILEQADLVHVHTREAASLLASQGPAPRRLLHHPHPSFLGAYPNDITDEAARAYFHLPPASTVFAFLGAARGYKGLDHLLAAFTRLHADTPDTALLLAGRQGIDSTARYLSPGPGLRVIPRFIEDATVQYVLRAADFMVLPYRAILTSGAAMLALGFARQVIAPALPGIIEAVGPDLATLCYKPDEPDGLGHALRAAHALGPADRAALRYAASRRASELPFSALGIALARALQTPLP